MISIIGSGTRKHLYQWDLNRQLRVLEPSGCTISQVHFWISSCTDALVVEVTRSGSTITADVPNILLQTSGKLEVYAVYINGDGAETLVRTVFGVIQRSKPADYVYTETEVFKYETVLAIAQRAAEDAADAATAVAAKQDTLTAGANIIITDNVISASGNAVNSVNGETGDVVLTASEVGADARGTAASAVSAHNSSATAHAELLEDTLGSYATQSYVTSSIAAAITGAIEGSY